MTFRATDGVEIGPTDEMQAAEPIVTVWYDVPITDEGPLDTLPDANVLGAPAPDLEDLDRRGEVLADRYRLEVLLGKGGSGAVYAALDQWHSREVAIKLMHSSVRASDAEVGRFLREARAMATVGHPGVVTVLDVGRHSDGSLFMVMQLLRGEQLWQAATDRKLDDFELVEVGRQLMETLAAAHARGVVHRDVKPENVFLTRDASGELHVKLVDFGIAKFLGPEARRAAFSTSDGKVLGTPRYMSPEACLGDRVDVGADLWAAAATLFFAFAGVPPFAEDQVGRLMMLIVRGRAPSLAEYRPDLPKVLTDAIDIALLRERELRWQSAGAMVEQLERAAETLRAR